MSKKVETVRLVDSLVLTCILCNRCFSTPSLLLKHLNTHDGSVIKCTKCNCDFNNEHSYNYHINSKMCKIKECKEQKLLQCSQCKKSFRGRRHFSKHMEGHTSNNCRLCDTVLSTRKQHVLHMHKAHNIIVKFKIFPCEHCEESFGRRSQLYYHCKKLHAGTSIVCMKCGVFLKQEDVKQHEEKHEAERPWKCKICNESFSRNQQYLTHMEGHDRYRCNLCNISFATKLKSLDHDLKAHQIRSADEFHVCHICGLRFQRPGTLKQHYNIHSGERPFFCKTCNKNFISLRGYKKHMKSSHSVDKAETCTGASKSKDKFDCDNIGKSSHNKEGSEKHPSYPQPYQCVFCNYKSTSKVNSKRHLALHMEDRKFVCEQCGSAFFALSNLQDHFQYVHSKERSFKCDQCRFTFKTKSSLTRHIQSHSDSRPYGCHCGQTYKRISHLQRHQRSTHGPTKSKRLQRMQLDESGAVVAVIEPKKTKAAKKVKVDTEPQSESSNADPTAPPVVSLFVADSGQVFTLQRICPSDLPQGSAHQNVGVDSYQSEVLQTIQVAYDQNFSASDSLTQVTSAAESQLVFTTVDAVEQQYHDMQLHEPVDTSLLDSLGPDEPFFANHEAGTAVQYQSNEISLTSDQTFYDTQHDGTSNFGEVPIL